MVSASHWVGLILPGMIEEPGSFSGIFSSAKPARGPQAYQRTSLAIFISAPASVRRAALTLTIASCADSAANLFGAETNGLPVSSAIFLRRHLAEARVGVEPGADRGAADRQGVHARHRLLDHVERLVELRHPARDHLAERERRRVLQVGAADHDDVVVNALALAPSVSRSACDRGQQHVSTSARPWRCASRSGRCRSTTGCG